MMRGFACSIRLTIAANASVRASRRSAAAGISAVSRAMALAACASAIVARGLPDGGAQMPAVTLQPSRGLTAVQSAAEQYGRLHVPVGLFEIARRVALRASDDLADHRFRAPAQLGVPRPHVH